MVVIRPVIDLTKSQPVIRLQKPKSVIGKIIEAEKKIITSPKTTAVLSGTLGTLLGGPTVGGRIALGVKSFLTGGTAAGLSSSPKIRKFVREKVLSPEKGGQYIAGIVEDPKQLIPKESETLGSKIKEGATKAGLIGAGAAAAVGGVAVAKKAIEKVRERAAGITETIPDSISSSIASAKLSTLPEQVTPDIAQIPGEVVPETPKKAATEEISKIPAINNRITVKPIISVKVSQNRKFINQKNIIRV